MEVKVLGTSNAWGPNPFLPEPPGPMTGRLSNGTSVEIRKYRTSLLVTSADKKKILVDCGPDFLHQVREFKEDIDIPDAVLLTHSHLDHIGGLDDLSLYRHIRPIPTYATAVCWDTVVNERGFGYLVGRVVAQRILFRGQFANSFYIGSVRVTPFPVEHSPFAPGAVGYVFQETGDADQKCVLYTGDFWALSNPCHKLFESAFDYAIIECDRATGPVGPQVGGGHMSLQEAGRILRDGPLSRPRPKQVVFVHFGDEGPKGTPSSYADWRDGAISELATAGLVGEELVKDEDAVIGYEGLVLV